MDMRRGVPQFVLDAGGTMGYVDARSMTATTARPSLATLEPVRFGEFLRDRNLISDEQWLAALADHWSAPRRQRIGDIIVDAGFLSIDVVEAEARVFHDDLDVVEVATDERFLPRSEKTTLPMPARA
jgi:hypothetical protein